MRKFGAVNWERTTEKGRGFLVAHIDEKQTPLIGYQVEMLLNNRVPGLLPLELRRNDRLLALYYHLEGFIELAEYLQSNLDAIGCLDVMGGILQALLNSQDYLLNLESFIMEEELVFIHPGTKGIGLVYVPAAINNDAATALSELAVRISGWVPDDSTEIKNGLLQAARERDLTISKMQKALNRLRISAIPTALPLLNNAPDSDFHDFWGEKECAAGRSLSSSQILNGLWRQLKGQARYWLERIGGGVSQHQNTGYDGYNQSAQSAEVIQLMKGATQPLALQAHAPASSCQGSLEIGMLTGAGKPAFPCCNESDWRSFPFVQNEEHSDIGFKINGMGRAMDSIFSYSEPKRVLDRRQSNPRDRETDLCRSSDDFFSASCFTADTLSHSEPITSWDNERRNEGEHMRPVRPPVLKIKQDKREETVVIDRDDFCLGRSRTLSDYWTDNSRLLGRVHARIVRRGDNYHIIDLHSRNGTYLNGRRLEPACPAILRSGDLIRLANLEIRFES